MMANPEEITEQKTKKNDEIYKAKNAKIDKIGKKKLEISHFTII